MLKQKQIKKLLICGNEQKQILPKQNETQETFVKYFKYDI